MQTSSDKVPEHIAIIPDGNGRWAQQHGLSIEAGHRKGVAVLEAILDACYELSVKVVTVYAFSSENWQREQAERTVLFSLINYFLETKLAKLIRQKIRIEFIGQLKVFPSAVQNNIQAAKTQTASFETRLLQIALGYGGRKELVRAAQKFATAVQTGNTSIAALNEESFKQYLDTAQTKDPDLIIRTSGEYRISNFLLYQSAYSEFYFTQTLWPDFTVAELKQAFAEFTRRERRFGKRPQQDAAVATLH